jgi:hypothetical protein
MRTYRLPEPSFRLLIPAAAALALVQLLHAPSLRAQDSTDKQEIDKRFAKMQQQIDAQQQQLDEYRNAIKTLQQQLAAATAANTTNSGTDATTLQQAVTDIREEQSVQQAEIAVHEQAKVGTHSRYNMRIGGLLLFNAFANDGAVYSVDVPVLAVPRVEGVSNGSLGASLRQSIVTLDVTGPKLWGARSYGNIQMDFFGGLSTADYTSTAGTVRMRAASLQMLWPSVNFHAGLERLLIAQFSPTSYATIGEPALAWSGNLWAWIPQLTAEKTFSIGEQQQLSFAGALADIPDPGPSTNPYLRNATAAESSRYPGSEGRISYAWGASQSGQTTLANAIAINGYWSPHNYGEYGSVDAWAVTADWRFALPRRFFFTGSAYKGAVLGGLGGGVFKDVSAYSYMHGPNGPMIYKLIPLRDIGGWAQLKFHPVDWFEANEAFGQDNGYAQQLRSAYIPLTNPYSGLARNQSFLSNVIFRPTNSILLSLEYRKLRSWQLIMPANEAQIFGMAAGFEF